MILPNNSHLAITHFASLTLIKEDLYSKLPKLTQLSELTTSIDKEFTAKLSEDGKQLFVAGLNQEALKATEQLIKQNLAKPYKKAVETIETELLQHNRTEIATKKGQDQFKLALADPTFTNDLFGQFITQLQEHNQIFNTTDTPHLQELFSQYVEKQINKYSDSLEGFNSLESVKAKLKLHHESNKIAADLRVGSISLDNLDPGPEVEQKVGYKIDINNLSKQLKHRLAQLKPGEKIDIGISIPDRAGLEFDMGRIALQHHTPLLVNLLLLLLVALEMIKKDDETRVSDAIKKLAQEEWLNLDLNKVNLKITQTTLDGKTTTTLLNRPLSEKLQKEIRNINEEISREIFAPRPMPEKEKNEDQEDGNAKRVVQRGIA